MPAFFIINKTHNPMTKKLLALMSLALPFAACDSDDAKSDCQVPQLMEFAASCDASSSKTALVNDANIVFSPKEKIAVFGSSLSTYDVFTGSNTAESYTTTFTGTAKANSVYYAVCPVSAAKSVTSGGNFVVELSSNQQFSSNGGFASGAHVMIATTTSSDKVFSFKSSCAFLKFRAEKPVTSLTINANGVQVSGKYTCTSTGEIVSYDAPQSTSITASNLAAGNNYYVCVLANEYAKGITITFTDTKGNKYDKSFAQKCILQRNKIYDCGQLTYEGDVVPDEPAPSGDGIVSEWKKGIITTYAESGTPFPMVQEVGLQSDYYMCAPSTYFFPDYMYGTCFEIKYGNKSMKFIGLDECPDGDNTTIDIFTDAVFQQLTGQSNTKLEMQYREIPYYTNQNLKFVVKGGSNEWFCGCRIYNGRYPVSKVEISKDGKTYYQFKEQNSKKEFFEFQTADNTTGKLSGQFYIRATDKYGHTVVGKVSNFASGAVTDLGANFEY